MKQYTKTFYDIFKVSIFLLLMVFVLVGCKNGNLNDHTSSLDNGEISEVISEEKVDTVSYEGEWNRTDVASYEWAKITISNWVENESFYVVLLANYADYGGLIEGTATFVSEDTAVVYDENLMEMFQGQAGDYGVYFQFKEDSIIVTHGGDVRIWFGGAGIVTAKGTYIQGEPEYTNVTDVSTIFTEEELKEIQRLLGDEYETMFEWVIEMGETEEYSLTEGTLWKAYYPPYGAVWCNILIYNDGGICIEGSYGENDYWFYSNTDATEMPVIE